MMEKQSSTGTNPFVRAIFPRLDPYLLPLAAAFLGLALFGLRDIILTPVLVRLFRSQAVAGLLQPVYWAFLGFAIALFARHFWIHRTAYRADLDNLLRYLPDALLVALIAVPFLYLTFTERLTLDFWLDEMMSLRRHIVTSVGSALFWYPAPNNHIFSNALSGVYLQLLGYKDLLFILENPHLLRLFYLFFGLGTIAFVALTAYRFISRWAGFIAVILLCTTIAYLNFIVQVRGYSPSLFFAAVLLFSILRYQEKLWRRDALISITLIILLVYTIPSNLYYVLGVVLFFTGAGIVQLWRNSWRGEISLRRDRFALANPPLTIAILVGGGLLIGGLLYLPVLSNILENRYITRDSGFFRGTAIPDRFLEVLTVFVSRRAWLFLIALVGLGLALREALRQKDSRRLFMIFFPLAGFLLPFLLSYIRGDNPFPRTFLVTLPSFIFLAALGLDCLINLIHQERIPGKTLAPVLVGFLFVAAYAGFFLGYRETSSFVTDVLVNEDIRQVEIYDDRLSASVFLDSYSVRGVLGPFLEVYDGAPRVFIDMRSTRYPWTLTSYLEVYGIPYQELTVASQITSPEAYIFLSYPQQSLERLGRWFPDLDCAPVSSEVSIYRVFKCRFFDAEHR